MSLRASPRASPSIRVSESPRFARSNSPAPTHTFPQERPAPSLGFHPSDSAHTAAGFSGRRASGWGDFAETTPGARAPAGARWRKGVWLEVGLRRSRRRATAVRAVDPGTRAPRSFTSPVGYGALLRCRLLSAGLLVSPGMVVSEAGAARGARSDAALIERANGIDEASAFEMLRAQSRSDNRELVDLAAAVVDGHRLLPRDPRPASYESGDRGSAKAGRHRLAAGAARDAGRGPGRRSGRLARRAG